MAILILVGLAVHGEIFGVAAGDIGILHHRYHLWYCKKEQAVCKVVGDSSRHRPDLHRAVLCRIGRRNVIFILRILS